MSDTTDKALDLADKWAQQIGAKISAAAPGAQDVAMDAVIVKAGSEILGWLLLAFFWIVAVLVARWAWINYQKACNDYDRFRRDEEVPFAFAGAISLFALIFITVGVIANFPKREIMGIAYPKGYVALMVLDAVKK